MFNDLNSSSDGTKEVDDIFSDVDKTPAPAAMPTFSGSSPAQSPIQNSVPNQVFPGTGKEAYLNVEDNMPAAGERSTKFLKMILIIVVIAAVISVVGYFVYTQFIQPKEDAGNLNTNPIINEINNTPEDIQNVQNTIEQQENNLASSSDLLNEVPTTTDMVNPIDPLNPGISSTTENPVLTENPTEDPAMMAVDTDGDGLTDQEETLAGTDINSVDTDGDGLTDYQEVKTYSTNPLSADTDGDTYPDGSEVEKGYNPNGEGKLETKV